MTLLVTVQLSSGNYLRFQVDTGAQCNVIQVKLYQKASQNSMLINVNPTKSSITSYGGTTLPVVTLAVKRDNSRFSLHCKLIDYAHIRPLLGRASCLQMGIISYLDIHRQHTSACTRDYQCYNQRPIYQAAFKGVRPRYWSSRREIPHSHQ